MDVKEFILNYVSDRDKGIIEFKWNGKHAEEFEDKNQGLRFSIEDFLLENSVGEKVPLDIIRDIFIAESEWAKEAWGTSRYYSFISELLLKNGNESIVECFVKGFHQSFDTYACMHSVKIDIEKAEKYIEIFECMEKTEKDSQMKIWLESGKEFMQKIIQGSASRGFVALKPGTPIKNIRVIYPLSAKIKFAFKRFLNKSKSN